MRTRNVRTLSLYLFAHASRCAHLMAADIVQLLCDFKCVTADIQRRMHIFVPFFSSFWLAKAWVYAASNNANHARVIFLVWNERGMYRTRGSCFSCLSSGKQCCWVLGLYFLERNMLELSTGCWTAWVEDSILMRLTPAIRPQWALHTYRSQRVIYLSAVPNVNDRDTFRMVNMFSGY